MKKIKKLNNNTKIKKTMNIKIGFLSFVLMLFCLILVGRIYYIKDTYGEEYEQAAIRQQVTKSNDIVIPPIRGSILDRNKQPLAISTTVYNVAVDPIMMQEIDQKEKEKKENGIEVKNIKENTISILSENLGIEKDFLYDIFSINPETGELKYPVRFKYIKKGISREEKENLQNLGAVTSTAVVYEKDFKRTYVMDTVASNVIGFVRGDAKWGLESKYDKEMSGIAGRSFRTYNSDSNVTSNDILAEDGSSIVTTLDYTIQQYAEQIAQKAMLDHNPEEVSIIVMNPNSGEIYAMAQGNTFNGNDPANPVALEKNPQFSEKWENMTPEERSEYLNSTWKNFAVSSTLEPGSIFKPMIVAAALEEGVISSNTTFQCNGGLQIADWYIQCHLRTGHGLLDVEGVLAQSCNVGMMELAQKLGKDKFYKYQKDFGVGELTGIDLPAESGNSSTIMYSLDKIGPTELATMSFGQSFNVTPIQILNAFCSIINGGKLMRPHIVSQIVDCKGNIIKDVQPEIIRRVISQNTSDIVRKDMESTLTVGTGKKAYIEGYAIGGKTGTAQQGRREDYIHSISFISYYPVDNPEIISMVLIHKPAEYIDGVTSPAPYMKELMENIINYKSYEPDYLIENNNEENNQSSTAIVGDYIGGSAYDAVNDIEKKGLNYDIIGSGNTITNQVPHSGVSVDNGSTILLYVTKDEREGEIEKVPDVLNKTYDEAVSILKQSGFEVTYEGELENSFVISQEPKSGLFADKGSEIKIILSPINTE